MEMQHKLITGLGLALAASSSLAQSVTLYGVMDVAVEHVTNTGASGAGQTRMPSLTGTVPSRLGFRGSEDLGDGLRAVFTLEMGLAPNSGVLNQGGRVFGRQSFVGLAGPWGSVTLGRQYTMLFWSLLEADTLGPNIHGLASFDSYIPNARADNSMAYRGTFSGFTAGATYIGAFAQRLPAGFETRPYRCTDGTVYVCLEGEGEAQVGDATYRFSPNDVWVVPSWHSLRLHASRDTTLFSFSDRPTQQVLGLWREQRL